MNGEVYEGIFENGQFVKSVNLGEKENNLNSSSDEIIFKTVT